MELYETLHADAITHLQPTELHEVDIMLELQRDIDHENTEREISEGGLSDHFLNNDRFFNNPDWDDNDYSSISGGQ